MTRKRFSICLVLALAMLGVFTMLMSITPLAYGASSQWLKPPYDFTLRMTELKCLRQGVNPFDVWHGDVVLPPFRPNYGSKVSGPEFNEDINAYAPWEYTAMLPLSFLPIKAAWVLYYLVMLASMVQGRTDSRSTAWLPNTSRPRCSS